MWFGQSVVCALVMMTFMDRLLMTVWGIVISDMVRLFCHLVHIDLAYSCIRVSTLVFYILINVRRHDNVST